jgi:hypothetical protein
MSVMPSANNDSPVKVTNGELVRAPKQWLRAATGEIVIKKKPAADAYVSWEIGGTPGGIAVVHQRVRRRALKPLFCPGCRITATA